MEGPSRPEDLLFDVGDGLDVDSPISRGSLLKKSLGAGVALAGLPLVTGMGATAPTRARAVSSQLQSPKRGGMLTLAVLSSSGGPLFPADYTSTQGPLVMIISIYDTLFRIDSTKPGYVLQPRLATGYKVSKGGRRVVITLRQGVKFHDGSPFTSEDVVYTMRKVLKGPSGAQFNSYFDESGVVAQGPHTVVFNLKQPNVFLPYLLREYRASIVKAGSKPSTRPIGTGPFKLAERYTRDAFALERNGSYWERGRPYLDGLRGVTIARIPTALGAMSDGSVDALYDSLPPNQIAAAQKDGLKLTVLPEYSQILLSINPAIAPFNDNRVRQAFKLGIDRRQWVQILWGGRAAATSDVPVVPRDPFYPRGLPLRRQQIAEAERLLEAAGHSGPVKATWWTSRIETNWVEGATLVAQQLQDAGLFDITVNDVPEPLYYSDHAGKSQMWIDSVFRRHPWSIAGFIYRGGGPEYQYWSPPIATKLINKAAAQTTARGQQAVLQQLFKLAANNSSFPIPAIAAHVVASRKNIGGLSRNSMTIDGYFGDLYKS